MNFEFEHFFWGKLSKDENLLQGEFIVVAKTARLSKEICETVINKVQIGTLTERDGFSYGYSFMDLDNNFYVVSRYQLARKIDRSQHPLHRHHILIPKDVAIKIGYQVSYIIEQSEQQYEELLSPASPQNNLPLLEVNLPEISEKVDKEAWDKISPSPPMWQIFDKIWSSVLDGGVNIYGPDVSPKQRLNIITGLQLVIPPQYRHLLTFATTITDPKRCQAQIKFVEMRNFLQDKDYIVLAPSKLLASGVSSKSQYLRWASSQLISDPDEFFRKLHQLKIAPSEGAEILSISSILDKLAENLVI